MIGEITATVCLSSPSSSALTAQQQGTPVDLQSELVGAVSQKNKPNDRLWSCSHQAWTGPSDYAEWSAAVQAPPKWTHTLGWPQQSAPTELERMAPLVFCRKPLLLDIALKTESMCTWETISTVGRNSCWQNKPFQKLCDECIKIRYSLWMDHIIMDGLIVILLWVGSSWGWIMEFKQCHNCEDLAQECGKIFWSQGFNSTFQWFHSLWVLVNDHFIC